MPLDVTFHRALRFFPLGLGLRGQPKEHERVKTPLTLPKSATYVQGGEGRGRPTGKEAARPPRGKTNTIANTEQVQPLHDYRRGLNDTNNFKGLYVQPALAANDTRSGRAVQNDMANGTQSYRPRK
jgi:hypothetical protein